MRKYPLVLVEWDDTITHSGWVDWGDLRDCVIPCQSVGWRVKSDPKSITLSAMRSEDGCAARQVIPKGCIRNIRKLKEV